MRIGIFGGTFDPPHIGHLILAQEAFEQLKLDKILWVLTPFPPHKTQQIISELSDRLKMVRLAISGNRTFELSRVDIDRDPPQYALDTVYLLKSQSPDDEFIYLMGADSLNDLPTWHQPADFVRQCDGIGVMLRNGERVDLPVIESQLPGITQKTIILKTPMIEISGSDIRERVKNGRPFRYFLPEKIYRYILKQKLYLPNQLTG